MLHLLLWRLQLLAIQCHQRLNQLHQVGILLHQLPLQQVSHLLRVIMLLLLYRHMAKAIILRLVILLSHHLALAILGLQLLHPRLHRQVLDILHHSQITLVISLQPSRHLLLGIKLRLLILTVEELLVDIKDISILV